MSNICKEEFLKKVESSDSIVDVVKAMYEYINYDSYSLLTKMNLNNGNGMKASDVNSMMKTIYTLWHKYICQINAESCKNVKAKQAILKIKNDPTLNPDRMSEEDCRNFIFNRFEYEFGDTGLLEPAQAQAGTDPVDDDYLLSDFIHFFPFDINSGNLECRLYLNVKPEHATKVAELVMQEAYKARKRLYGKVWTGRGRNDTLLFYTTYKSIEATIELIDRVKSVRPELFEGCEKVNPLLGKINGYIGFGEEPQYKHSSFNSERADAIEEFYDDLLRKNYKLIGNYSGLISTSMGENLEIKEYILYRVRKSFVENINKQKQELRQQSKDHKYIELREEIINEGLNQLDGEVGKQLEDMTNKIMASLKQGRRPNVYSVNVNIKGKREFINFDYDIAKKLFNVFNIDEVVDEYITEENLKPYFDKHHVSVKHPYLNKESEEYENKK